MVPDSMVSDSVILFLSMAGLLVSADVFVSAVVRLAERLQVSTLAIGLTVVAIGTSLPEVAASIAAALRNHPEIAFGNVVGSNICNIGLIIGLPAMLMPITCSQSVVRREGLQMLAITALFSALAFMMAEVPRILGCGYVVLFFIYVFKAFRTSGDSDKMSEDSQKDISAEENEDLEEALHGVANIIIRIVVSLAILLISSEYVVQSTINLARALEISETVIALSLIALGTSLPELSVSVAAAKRQQGDIVIGNIVGSNISNILLVIGTAAIINPLSLELTSLKLDLPFMGLLSILMVLFISQKQGITRVKGGLLLALYALFIWRCFAYPG